MRRESGFTLTELAVVLAIVGFLLGGLMLTLSAQVDSRNTAETARRLEQARELLLSFAIVKGRLPCPATSGSAGDEDPAGGGTCTTNYAGFLPARAIGFQPVDGQGFAVDAWGNRMRYAVSATTWGTTPFARYTKQHVAASATASWSLTQTPADLVICNTAVAGTSCAAGTSVTNQNVVVAIVHSTGKNGAGSGTNEAENTDGDALFVSRTRDPADAAGGEFDDALVWIPVGLLYGRMVAAGVLP